MTTPTTNHYAKCPVAKRADEYREYLRRENTAADMDTDQFESDPVCDCATRRLEIAHERFAIAAGRAIGRRGY